MTFFKNCLALDAKFRKGKKYTEVLLFHSQHKHTKHSKVLVLSRLPAPLSVLHVSKASEHLDRRQQNKGIQLHLVSCYSGQQTSSWCSLVPGLHVAHSPPKKEQCRGSTKRKHSLPHFMCILCQCTAPRRVLLRQKTDKEMARCLVESSVL